jgi:hypothetical protein
VTATPVPDEEVMPLEGWIVLDELEDCEDDAFEEAVPVEEEAGAADAEVPGMVAAQTAAKTPTPATAPSDTPTVRRWRRRRASSRDRARARAVCVGSMPDSLVQAA